MGKPRYWRLPDRWTSAPLRVVAAAFVLVVGLADASPGPPPPPSGELRAGGFAWTPQLAPRGPVLIVVSLLEQRAYVYRNGVRIGMASVSTGMPGYETPTGVFSILQKRREHYSNLYDNAPMPYMQRLTWDGIALHAGKVPGYPASHGCVRLPFEFSEKLFGITTQGMTVVVTGSIPSGPVSGPAGLFSALAPPAAAAAPEAPEGPWSWRPERSPAGPLNVLLSTTDQQMVVLRNGIEIGWAPIALRDVEVHGTYVYTLLEGTHPEPSLVVAERPGLNWLAVPIADSPPQGFTALREAFMQRRILLPPAFATHVYEELTPGAMLVVTDESIRGRALVLPATLLEANEPSDPAVPAGDD